MSEKDIRRVIGKVIPVRKLYFIPLEINPKSMLLYVLYGHWAPTGSGSLGTSTYQIIHTCKSTGATTLGASVPKSSVNFI